MSDYLIGGEYKQLRRIGSGSFGEVFEVEWKYDVNRPLIMKMIRNEDDNDIGTNELDILKKIGKLDPEDKSCCIKLFRAYLENESKCTILVFPKLGDSVDYFQKKGGELSLDHIRHIGFQTLTALAFLHENSIVHYDLKLDNILLEDSDAHEDENGGLHLKRTDIKLIDFGLSMDIGLSGNQLQSHLVHNEIYRAPEVELRIGHGMPSDLWCLGCILFAMYKVEEMMEKGVPEIRLAILERILGKFPEKVIEKITRPSKKQLFDKDGYVKLFQTDRDSICCEYKTLEQYDTEETEQSIIFFDLLRGLLDLDPETRITAENGLNHPFFSTMNQANQNDAI